MTQSGNGSKQSLIRGAVLDLVDELGPGGALPSERRLAADLHVSRPTVRAALDALVRDGLLVRRRGSGTYVREPKIHKDLTLSSFSADMLRRGMTPASRTLSLTTTPAGARLGRCLHVSPSARILLAVRLRLADGEPMALERLHVPAERVPGLAAADLERHSFYELLEQRYGIRLTTAVQRIEPTVTSEEESEALEVPLYSPAFLFQRTARDEAGEIVEFAESIYRGDRYELVTELTPPAADVIRGGARIT